MRLVTAFHLYLVLVIGLIEFLRVFRSERLNRLAARIVSFFAFHLSRGKRAKINRNLERALSEKLSPTERVRLTRRVFEEYWDEVFWWAERDVNTLVSITRVVGMEHLNAALERGRGVILWESSGFGKRILAKRVLRARGVYVTQVHAHLHVGGLGAGGANSWLLARLVQPYFDARTKEIVRDVIYLSSEGEIAVTRRLFERLAQNESLCLAFEGAVGQKHLTLPFLGNMYKFATGGVTLAKVTGAPLIPIYCTREGISGFLIEIGPPIELPHKESREQIVAMVLEQQVRALEARIREHPEWYRDWNLLDPSQV